MASNQTRYGASTIPRLPKALHMRVVMFAPIHLFEHSDMHRTSAFSQSIFVFEMCGYTPAVAQPRSWRARICRRTRELGLAVRVQCIVQRRRQAQLLMIVLDGRLKPADNRGETGSFWPARSARRNIRIANDPAHL